MPTSLLTIVAIGCAGALGAAARFGIVEWMARRWGSVFPLPTFLINITGAFALGVVLTMPVGDHPGTARLLASVLGTGFLGGYTTFSTLSFETHRLSRRGHSFHAWLNALGTLAAGLAAVGVGIIVGHYL